MSDAEYAEKQYTEVKSSVRVDGSGPGEADVTVLMEASYGAYRVELTSRVTREDLPELINDLFGCVVADDRPALLAKLAGH